MGKDGVKHSTMKVRVNNFAPIVKGTGTSRKSTEDVESDVESVEDTVAF